MTDKHENSQNAPNSDYEIGYGRPPKKTQFKPGQSGNPKGRKRKPKSLQAQMQRAVARKVRITEGGKSKSLPLQDVIIRTLVNKAAKGDLRTAAFVFKVQNSPEFAETETFDQGNLSPDDQAMLDQVMSQFSRSESSDSSPNSDPSSEETDLATPNTTPETLAPETTTQIKKDDSDDE